MPDKRLISFSLWGDDPLYIHGFVANVLLAPRIYPGWTVRVYADPVALASLNDFAEMPADLAAESPSLCAIPIRDGTVASWALPNPERLVPFETVAMPRCRDAEGMAWRFLAAADPRAEFVVFRDADSRLNVREKAAVDAWQVSGKTLHVMRDHPDHVNWPILGGMWGVRGGELMGIADVIGLWRGGFAKLWDQHFLAEVLTPWFRAGDVMQHLRNGLPNHFAEFGASAEFPPHPPFDGFVGQIVRPDTAGGGE